MLRRVHREQVVALAGPRALLMQAAQPVAFAGFFASTGALENPYPRLERTAAALNTVMFGTRAAADRVTARIRRVHSRVRGQLAEAVGPFPAGTPWAADDPELLLWIIATLVDSSLLVYERYVRRLTPAERQALLELTTAPWRELFGLRRPASSRALARTCARYLAGMLAGDAAAPQPRGARARHPDRAQAAGAAARPTAAGTGQLHHRRPAARRLRRAYGLRWDPLRGLVHRGGAEYARRVLVPILPGRVRYNRRPAAGRTVSTAILWYRRDLRVHDHPGAARRAGRPRARGPGVRARPHAARGRFSSAARTRLHARLPGGAGATSCAGGAAGW